jgi:hypothetical protein
MMYLKEIRHIHLVLVLFVRVGEDVGSLQGLREKAEDVVNREDGLRGIGRASDVLKGRIISRGASKRKSEGGPHMSSSR